MLKFGGMSETIKQIYLWYGDNDFEIMEKVANWKDAFAKKHGDFNVDSIDFGGGESKDRLTLAVKNALTVNTLFGSNKLVVIRDFFTDLKKNPEDAVKIITNSFESLPKDFFVIFFQTSKPLASSVIFKKIKKAEQSGLAEIKEFVAPKIFEMEKWIDERSKKHGACFSIGAKKELVLSLGNDLWAVEQEVCKLANYKNGQTIEAKDVREMVKGKYNGDIFEFMDAISSKNKKKAFQLFADQLNSGANEFYLLTMLVRQFRIIWQVAEAMGMGNSSADDIAREYKIHPYVVKKNLVFAKSFPLTQLKKIYRSLLDFEIKMKTTSIDFELLIDLLLVEL
ncbi:MAG: DNA polymerase III subunit delta [Patescibacteria group bacterium]